MMSYINETDFVIENKQLVYPEIVTDGLQLYYDAKGKRDTDYHRDTMLDMSGNKNHGKLQNFAYEKHSGYKDGLVFDYIDDKLVRPRLNLKPDDFTFMLNGNIISFSPDGTVKRVQDGEVIESKGLNMLYELEKGTTSAPLNARISYNYAEAEWVDSEIYNTYLYNTVKYTYKDEHKYYISYKAKPDGPVNLRIYANQRYLDGDITNPILNEYNFRSGIVEGISRYSHNFNIRLWFNVSGSVIGTKVEIKDVTMIDLTETFGAGNEPTKEQMDEIIQRFGFIPNAQDLIDRIEYKGNDLGDMENIIDGLYKTEVLSGEEIYTDKADDSVVHVEIDGKSVGGGSGKNLFDIRMIDESITSAGATVGAPIKLKPNTTYTLSTNATPSSTLRDVFFDINRTAPSSGTNGVNANGLATITTDSSGDAIVWVRARNSNNKYDLDDFIYGRNWIQLEEGSTATAYEPPAPTPDYPVEIHSLNDFDVVSSVGGRNLVLNSSALEASGLGATSGTRAEYQTINTGESYMDLEEGETITISFDIEMKIATKNPTLQVYNSNRPGPVGILNVSVGNQLQGEVGETINKRISFTTQATLRDSPRYSSNTLEFYSNYGSDNFYKISKLKVERGNIATDWTPAPEDILESDNHPLIDKSNLLLDEPLRSVEDVKDRLFRDSDGLWKIERNVAEYKADGTETWMHRSGLRYDMTTSSLPYPTYLLDNNPRTKVASSHFIRTGGEQIHGSTYVYSRSPRIMMDGITVEDIPAFMKNQHDKETPVTWVYQTQPRTETLSQSLQDKLNNLRSFQDSNYVYTSLPNEDNYLSENLKPTLHAKFLYNNWYKEDRVINNLMIYNRALTNEEMIQNYKTIKRRWGM